jgi:hypothetical protein
VVKRKILLYLTLGFIVILTVSLALLPACGEKTPSPTPYFPVQAEVQELGLNALLSGELVLDDGCLRVYDNLILWPYGYTVEMEGDDIWVVNEHGEWVVNVGDRVQMGGGVISAEFAEEKIGRSLPEGCMGPFWLVAFSVEKFE